VALQFNRTDSATGHQYTVYARIDLCAVVLGDASHVTLNLYDSMSAAQSGLSPVLDPDIITLTSDDLTTLNPDFVTALGSAAQAGSIHSPADALLTALYLVLKQRPAYATAIDV